MQISANSLSLQAVNFLIMTVFTTKQALENALTPIREEDSTVGFVPTMGALHEGHLSLILKALAENDFVVVSVFVNPTQFNSTSDLAEYPRTLAQDLAKLETLATSKILVYTPEVQDIYGDSIEATAFDFGGLEFQMEGKFRPGHFNGVGTVVQRLFEIVQPHFAYFGEKDFQQLLIIKKLVQILKLPIQVIGCPIARAENGLALSSRNMRLSPKHQVYASKIYSVLKKTKEKFKLESPIQIKAWVADQFKNDPVLSLEYFEISEESSLIPMKIKQHNTNYRAFVAVYAGDVRLIDNIALN